jgi:hypothetical protein
MTTQYEKYVKPRMESDPEYKAKCYKAKIQWNAKKFMDDPVYRAKHMEETRNRLKLKYQNDPEYREHQREKARQRCNAKKALKCITMQNTNQLVC